MQSERAVVSNSAYGSLSAGHIETEPFGGYTVEHLTDNGGGAVSGKHPVLWIVGSRREYLDRVATIGETPCQVRQSILWSPELRRVILAEDRYAHFVCDDTLKATNTSSTNSTVRAPSSFRVPLPELA